jgi:hypothetical protein
MPQTSLPDESRTFEPDMQKRTSKSTSTNYETESRLYLSLSTRVTSFKVK